MPLQTILDEVGEKEEDIFKMSRADATKIVGEAGAKWVVKEHEKGNVDWIISWAGLDKHDHGYYLMRALPFGVPKFMLPTWLPVMSACG